MEFEGRELEFLCFLSYAIEMQDGSKISKVNMPKEGKMFVKCAVNTKTQKPKKEVRIGVLGASGYTGSEVLYLTHTS
jgi:hypothetical protein